MNLLQNIFFEFFNEKYYQNNSWRAYIEYISSKLNWFTWNICFFHFSLLKDNSNWVNALEILKFIKLFYSNAYLELYPILKYAIKNNVVVSINSLNEYEFVIKFWNENQQIRNLLSYLIKKYTYKDIIINNNVNTRFFELHIDVNKKFSIKFLKIYNENFELNNNKLYKEWYIDKNNIFMKLDINIIDLINNKETEWLLIKLKNPIRFSESKYLLDNYFYTSLYKYFKKEDLYLWFVEKWCCSDLIYFTNWYSIKA